MDRWIDIHKKKHIVWETYSWTYHSWRFHTINMVMPSPVAILVAGHRIARRRHGHPAMSRGMAQEGDRYHDLGFKGRLLDYQQKWGDLTIYHQRKLGSNLPSYGWLLLNEGWCESLHHITMRSVRLYSMNGGVRVDITSLREVWDYTQRMVVWELASHHDEKCETILNEWWCVSLHSGCRSQWKGCMGVVVLCCHVRREMRIWILMLQNAL